MWFKKKKKNRKNDDFGIKVMVIPEIFYGGADPLIYNKPKEEKISKFKKKSIKKKDQVSLPIFKKKFIYITIGIFVIFVAGIVWYYLRQSTPPEIILPPQPQAPEIPKTTPPPPTPTPTPTPPEEISTPPSLEEQPISFSRILLTDSSDIDSDSLTDLEEELLGTDSGVWDTDEDGYYDGQEIFNLYNPKGFAPVKLIDSGLVREYINPRWQYRVYYPIGWEEASVDEIGDQVIFSSITGDFIEIRALKNEQSDPFITWFANNIEGQRYSDLVPFTNRFDIGGLKRKDNLVAYFTGDNVIYVMIYNPASGAQDIPFRHIMQIMYQSFRLGKVFIELPEQSVLPLPTQ